MYGEIYVATDKPHYTSGENVTGKIYLNFHSAYPGNTIFLKLKGLERCKFQRKHTRHHGTGKNRRKSTYIKNYYGNCTFFRIRIPIYQFQNC